ncbi:hypothetical protein [Bacillus subtilis]
MNKRQKKKRFKQAMDRVAANNMTAADKHFLRTTGRTLLAEKYRMKPEDFFMLVENWPKMKEAMVDIWERLKRSLEEVLNEVVAEIRRQTEDFRESVIGSVQEGEEAEWT